MFSRKQIFGLAATGSILASAAVLAGCTFGHQQELNDADAVITTGHKDGKTTAFLLKDKDDRGDFIQYSATPVDLSDGELNSVKDKVMSVDTLNGKLQNALKNSVSAAQDAIKVLDKIGTSYKVKNFFDQVNAAAPEAKDSYLLANSLFEAQIDMDSQTPHDYQERNEVDAASAKASDAVEDLRIRAGMLNALPANLKPPGFSTY
jgi:hypothetical protein